MDKKYELTDTSIRLDDKTTLYRIRALKDFNNVEKGTFGGFVESEDNLSQEGDCWIYDNAKVYGNAKVSNDARVEDESCVFGNARVFGDAVVSNMAKVYENAKVYKSAWIQYNSKVHGDTEISGRATIRDDSDIFGSAHVTENSIIYDALVYGNATVKGDSIISSGAKILGNTVIDGKATIRMSGYIDNAKKYICVGPIGDNHGFITFYVSVSNIIYVSCTNFDGGYSWFNGSIYSFEKTVRRNHFKDDKKSKRMYLNAIKFAKKHFKTVLPL